MKVAVVLGTRPEIVKLASLITLLARPGEAGVDHVVIHTGQHADPAMDADCFADLGLNPPHRRLEAPTAPGAGDGAIGAAGAAGAADATGGAGPVGTMAACLRVVLQEERPDVVVVQGDTNSALAGTLSAHRLGIPVAHVEAGLRSHDPRMPEEANRRVIDALSHWLFAPTPQAAANLVEEGIAGGRAPGDPTGPVLEVVGNTVVDALAQAAPGATSATAAALGLRPGAYALVTAHRAENVDDPAFLEEFLAALGHLRTRDLPVVWPVHPRSRRRLETHGLWAAAARQAHLVDPVGYREMLALERDAALVLTDSGGVQEEACVLGVRCAVARLTTDRPETVEVGAAVLGGLERAGLAAAIDQALGRRTGGWAQPYGDGRTGARVLEALRRDLG